MSRIRSNRRTHCFRNSRRHSSNSERNSKRRKRSGRRTPRLRPATEDRSDKERNNARWLASRSCSAGSRSGEFSFATSPPVWLISRPRCPGRECFSAGGSARKRSPSITHRKMGFGGAARSPRRRAYSPAMAVTVVEHPLAGHLLLSLRDERTPPSVFRSLTKRLTSVLMIEATRDLPTRPRRVRTPLEEAEGRVLAEPIVAVPILRAGLGMLDAVVEQFPEVRVGYLGLERDEATFQPSEYYAKLPDLGDARTYVLDPMLATGGSASAALESVKNAGAQDVRMVSVVSAPEGVKLLQDDHPDVDIVTASLDRQLNSTAYILPGLGDFGDRR